MAHYDGWVRLTKESSGRSAPDADAPRRRDRLGWRTQLVLAALLVAAAVAVGAVLVTRDSSPPSLDPAQVASVLFDVLKRMQEDDQYRMQVQMQMAQLAMGDEQKASAEQAIGALQAALAQEGVTLDGPGSIPPPGK